MWQLSNKGSSTSLFYVVDWLPPEFGAVGQYALTYSNQAAARGRDVHLIGLTRDRASTERTTFAGCGRLTIQRLQAKQYEKAKFFQRLLWTLLTNFRLVLVVLSNPNSYRAEILFTGAPPFMLYFAITLKYLRRARLIYRITDFYPEVLIAHLGQTSPLLALLERFTWWLRKRVDVFEVLGEDQRTLLLRGGISEDRIIIKRYTAPILVSGRETAASKPPTFRNRKVLLYSGNYGVAHEIETVVQGLVHHHRLGSGLFGLWLNATGQNADLTERRLRERDIPVARTSPVALHDLPALLAAADAHLITLRTEFSGIVSPSKVHACILSGKPIIFVGPKSSDVHLLCTQMQQPYFHVTPGDVPAFAHALQQLESSSAYVSAP
jgi:hypothetical protein